MRRQQRAERHTILLSTAYFVPGALTVKALVAATKRGVAEQIIIPGADIDSVAVRAAWRELWWGDLLKAGAAAWRNRRWPCSTKIGAAPSQLPWRPFKHGRGATKSWASWHR